MHEIPTRIVAAVTLTSLLVSACASYAPITTPISPGRATVRLSLTDAGRSENIGAFGSQITSLEGEIRSADDSVVTLSVTEIGRVAADNQAAHGETIALPARLIERADRKKLLVGRSLLLAGAVVGVVVWLGLQAGHGGVSYRRPTPPPTPGQ